MIATLFALMCWYQQTRFQSSGMHPSFTMRQHVTRLSQTCFFHLRRLRSLRRQLGRDARAVTPRLL